MGKKANAQRRAARELAASSKAKPRKQPPAQVRRYAVDGLPAIARDQKWDERQTRAARAYKAACETLASPGTGSLDMDRVSGGGSVTGTLPAEHQLEAANIKHHAVRVMGGYCADLAHKMIVEERTTREIARLVFLSDARGWRDEIVETVRAGLSALADELYPASKASPRREFAWSDGDRAGATGVTEVLRAHVHVGGKSK